MNDEEMKTDDEIIEMIKNKYFSENRNERWETYRFAVQEIIALADERVREKQHIAHIDLDSQDAKKGIAGKALRDSHGEICKICDKEVREDMKAEFVKIIDEEWDECKNKDCEDCKSWRRLKQKITGEGK